jgi:hypothetical protein
MSRYELRAARFESPNSKDRGLRWLFETGFRGVKTVRFFFRSSPGSVLPVLFCWAFGCGSPPPKEVPTIPAQANLRSLALGYANATTRLKHPPKNVEDLKPYLKDLGDPAELLKSPTDGTELAIGWGTDIMKQKDGQFVIWAYDKSTHGENKRWVIRGRFPAELTEEQVQNSVFATGLKKPS